MKYYSLSYSTKIEDIGFYPQTCLKNTYDPTLDVSHRKIKWNSFPDFIPNYELELNVNAFRTSYLDASDITTGFVVKSEFKRMLESCKLPPHRFYPIKVFQRDELLDYYWFHFIADVWQFMDLEKTSIMIFNRFNLGLVNIMPVKSVSEIKKIKSSLSFEHTMRFNEVVFNNEFPRYDVFELSDVQYINIISEKLKTLIEETGLTGCQMNEFGAIKVII